MLKIDQIKIPVDGSRQDIIKKISRTIGVPEKYISNLHIVKRSLDARKKPNLFYVYSVAFSVNNEEKIFQK